MKKAKFDDYANGLVSRLKDPLYAAEYLNALLEDPGGLDQEAFLLALRDIAVAHGIGKVSKRAKLGRESLYKSLSGRGNPKFSTLALLLKSIGLKISIEARSKRAL